jgi:signal transduction histidine kinase
MPQGLPRKLRYAFVLQAMLTSVAIIVGIYVTGLVVREVLTTQRLHAEAESYWRARAADPAAPLPRTSTVSGYFVPIGGSDASLPAELRGLAPGVTEFSRDRRKALLDARVQGRLYIVMSFSLLDTAIRWANLLSIVLALCAVYAATWFTYRTSRRLVEPVNWLAQQVSRWDPGDADSRAIEPSHIPGGGGSEVQQLSQALQNLATRIRDFVRRERDFTRDASHELRTPLTVVRVAIDTMLDDSETTARAQRTLLRMQRAGRDMETVIDAFLILAREHDAAVLAEDFDVSEIVADQAEKARVRLQDKPVELQVEMQASPRLHASPRALALILDNLLENACAFTDRGRVEVSLEADRIVVRDTGIGMSQETLQRVYEPFYRADQFGGGKGMGLSIVRRLSERFGWPVTLDSVAGVGTTATIGFSRHLVRDAPRDGRDA